MKGGARRRRQVCNDSALRSELPSDASEVRPVPVDAVPRTARLGASGIVEGVAQRGLEGARYGILVVGVVLGGEGELRAATA